MPRTLIIVRQCFKAPEERKRFQGRPGGRPHRELEPGFTNNHCLAAEVGRGFSLPTQWPFLGGGPVPAAQRGGHCVPCERSHDLNASLFPSLPTASSMVLGTKWAWWPGGGPLQGLAAGTSSHQGCLASHPAQSLPCPKHSLNEPPVHTGFRDRWHFGGTGPLPL